MKIEITNEVDVESVYQADEIALIFKVLIEKGMLTGVKGGATLIHFDRSGKFQGVSFNYKPWWRGESLDNN
jgi:hypothetical protein